MHVAKSLASATLTRWDTSTRFSCESRKDSRLVAIRGETTSRVFHHSQLYPDPEASPALCCETSSSLDVQKYSSPTNMSHHEKDYDNTESAWPLSDDESTPFRREPASVHKRYLKLGRVIAVGVVLSHIILGGFYMKLKFHYMELESRVRELQPELFPCWSPHLCAQCTI
jgi:hypothetical protein